MKRMSVSLLDELADWVENEADRRGASRAKVIRDAIARAQSGANQQEVERRLEALESRLTTLESQVGDSPTASIHSRETSSEPTDRSEQEDDNRELVERFEQTMADYPPKSDAGTSAVVETFALLLAEGPLSTGEIRQHVYETHGDKFNSERSMWQSIQRYFDDIPGIKSPEYGKRNADPDAVPTHE